MQMNDSLGIAGVALVLANRCVFTGNAVSENGSAGMFVGEGTTVIGNTVHGNNGVGLTLGAGSGYGDNVINNNTGTVSGGVQMGVNVCDGNTTCP